MHIFDKRPLSLILCIMLGGFVFFERSNGIVRLSLIIIAAALLALFFFFLIRKDKKPLLLILSVALCASMLLSQLYFKLWFYADERFDGNVTVTGTVTELSSLTSYSANYIIKTDNINGEPFSSYKLSVYMDRETADMIAVGSVVSFDCVIKSHENKDSAPYKYAEGISAVCEEVTQLTVHEESSFILEDFFAYLRENILRYSVTVSDEDTGEMLSALLWGERDSLSREVNLDFKRLGITHILALSGMHLAILSLGIERLLSAFRVRKNIRVALTAVFTILYMALTGFSTSVLRAGIMLILSTVLYFLSRDQDSVTSLFIAVGIIVLISPYAIFDISLWLSAFATLGVIIYSELQAERNASKEKKNKFITAIKDSLSISVLAITATQFITHFSFSGISILSPVATLVFSVLTQCIMYIGAVMLIIGAFIPIGAILSPIVKFTASLAEWMSSFDVYLSEDYPALDVIVIILSILFFAFIILNIKKKKLALISILVVFCTLYLSVGIFGVVERYDDTVIYVSDEKSDEFIIRSEGEICFISSSQYSRSTGYGAVRAATESGITRLDKYYVTHLSRGLEDDLNVVLSNILTETVYIPSPENEEEDAIVEKLLRLFEDYRTEIILYNNYEKTEIGNFEIHPTYSVAYGEGSSQNAFFIHGENKNILYLSSGMMNKSTLNFATESINHASDIVFGCHGKSYKSKTYFEAESALLACIVVSGDNLFLKQENAIFYSEKGCEIYSHPKSVTLFD